MPCSGLKINAAVQNNYEHNWDSEPQFLVSELTNLQCKKSEQQIIYISSTYLDIPHSHMMQVFCISLPILWFHLKYKHFAKDLFGFFLLKIILNRCFQKKNFPGTYKKKY